MYTTKEVAAMFRVGQPQVIRWVKLGYLHPVQTPGGQYRYRRAEVDGLLRGNDDVPSPV